MATIPTHPRTSTRSVIFVEGAAPGTPPAGFVYAYVKSDGLLYWKDDTGTEYAAGGDVSAHTGDTTDAHDASAISIADAGTFFTGTEVEAALQELAAAAGGGAAYGQAVDYPASFSGDVINGSDATPFADVAAFDTKAVLNSRILHLQTLGASKSHRVRVTLGTTKAGVFDVRACLSCQNQWWATDSGDTYTELRLSTAADAQIAVVRFYGIGSTAQTRHMIFRVGDSALAGLNSNHEPWFAPGTDVTLRITRDGSDVLRFYYGLSNAPMALVPVVRQGTGTYQEQYTVTEAGTLARIEIAHVTVAGPSATYQVDTYVDYVASV